MIFTAVIGCLIIVLYDAIVLKQELLQERQHKITGLIDTAHDLILHYEQQESQGLLSREQAQLQARTAIAALRYEGSNYFFISLMTRLEWSCIPSNLS